MEENCQRYQSAANKIHYAVYVLKIKRNIATRPNKTINNKFAFDSRLDGYGKSRK